MQLNAFSPDCQHRVKSAHMKREPKTGERGVAVFGRVGRTLSWSGQAALGETGALAEKFSRFAMLKLVYGK